MEQGTFNKPKEYNYLSDEWELNRRKKYNKNPNLRNLEYDYPIDSKNSPISLANFNGVGGSTIIYNAHLPRFKPKDFKTKKFDNVAEDWPISYKDLEKYYELNEKIMGVAGLKNDPEYPKIKKLLPPVNLDYSGKIIHKSFKKLNWHCWPSYSGIATKKIKKEERLNSKSDANNSYWKMALKNGVKLLTKCRAYKIKVNKYGKVTGVYYFDKLKKKKIFKDSYNYFSL